MVPIPLKGGGYHSGLSVQVELREVPGEHLHPVHRRAVEGVAAAPAAAGPPPLPQQQRHRREGRQPRQQRVEAAQGHHPAVVEDDLLRRGPGWVDPLPNPTAPPATTTPHVQSVKASAKAK